VAVDLKLVGHNATLAFFARSLTLNRLCSTYLLLGPSGIGKRLLARCCAQLILCQDRQEDSACGQCSSCSALSQGTHPRWQERDFTREKKSDQSAVDVVRSFIEEVYRLGADGGKMIYLIPNIQAYSRQVQNALLKTLEEPPEGVIFMLTSDQPDQVLGTITSRSQNLPVAPLSQKEMQRVMAKLQWNMPQQDLILRMAQGSVQFAKQLSQEGHIKLIQWIEKQLIKCDKDFIQTTESFMALATELEDDEEDWNDRKKVGHALNIFERLFFQKCLERVRLHFVGMQVFNTAMEELISTRRSVQTSGHVALSTEIYMQIAFSRLQQIMRFVRIPETEPVF
jgi:DNA polymerase III delta prime subunit